MKEHSMPSSSSRPYFINPLIFFIFHERTLCLWHYGDHAQYQLDGETMTLLMRIAAGEPISATENNLSDLIEANIIRSEPYADIPWGWDKLSHMFHKGTQNIPELWVQRSKDEMIQDFITFSDSYGDRSDALASTTSIPNKTEGISLSLETDMSSALSLHEAVQSRMTSRHFLDKPIGEEDLSYLLRQTFGEIHSDFEGLGNSSVQALGKRKSSPSAGGIHSIEAYVTILKVTGIPAGLYRYDGATHTLHPVHNQITNEKLIQIMGDQFYMAGLSFGVFFVSNLERVWTKYLHSRAYREIFLDAGHLSQTFQLLATSRSLGTWVSAYFRDNALLDFLTIDPAIHAPLLFAGVGHSNRQAIHPDIITAIEKAPS